jgi:signal transduction histidine kinase
LKAGVEEFGAGALHRRVSEDGRDEVAALGASFNRAAARIEALLRSHQSLLANASHELRSPLARLKMAVAMIDDAPVPQRAALQAEIGRNIGELDALVEEVLLASRLQAQSGLERGEPVALLALARDEAARHGVAVVAAEAGAGGVVDDLVVAGDERLLRRALRNLLENARRYGRAPRAPGEGGLERDDDAPGQDAGDDGLVVEVGSVAGGVLLRVCDRGPGVPEAWRERIFEPFARLPGHAEREGGVGLGLALVRQIVQQHGGTVRCLPRDGGGSCFEFELPLAAR